MPFCRLTVKEGYGCSALFFALLESRRLLLKLDDNSEEKGRRNESISSGGIEQDSSLLWVSVMGKCGRVGNVYAKTWMWPVFWFMAAGL